MRGVNCPKPSAEARQVALSPTDGDGIAAVVKELPHGVVGLRPPCLLAVDRVQGLVYEQCYSGRDVSPPWCLCTTTNKAKFLKKVSCPYFLEKNDEDAFSLFYCLLQNHSLFSLRKTDVVSFKHVGCACEQL